MFTYGGFVQLFRMRRGQKDYVIKEVLGGTCCQKSIGSILKFS